MTDVSNFVPPSRIPWNKGKIMTQTAIIGSGPIANPIREAFYATD